MASHSEPAGSSVKWDPNRYYCDDQVAANYDSDRFSSLAGTVYLWLERRALLRALAVVPGNSHVLDLPCGTGRLAEILLAAGYRVAGADISAQMLDIAQRRLTRFGDRFTCEVKDVRHASGESRKYPAVLCARVLMHFPLEEQIEFLKGVAAFSERYVVVTHSFDSAYQRMRRWAKRFIVGATAPAAHPVSNVDIRNLLAQSGLREVRRIRLPRLVSEAIIIVAERLEIANASTPQSA